MSYKQALTLQNFKSKHILHTYEFWNPTQADICLIHSSKDFSKDFSMILCVTMFHPRIHYCCRCLDVLWPLPSCVSLLNLALSVAAPPTGTGIPDPLKLILPPDEGVANLLSLILVSMGTSAAPPSAPLIASANLVGTFSLPARPARPASVINNRQHFMHTE